MVAGFINLILVGFLILYVLATVDGMFRRK